MVPQWKRWLGAAAVLLLVGAGCQAEVQQEASLDQEAGEAGETQAETESATSLDLEADAAIDAALGESEADADAALEGNSDADVMNNDAAELNAYGQTYVESEIK